MDGHLYLLEQPLVLVFQVITIFDPKVGVLYPANDCVNTTSAISFCQGCITWHLSNILMSLTEWTLTATEEAIILWDLKDARSNALFQDKQFR